MEKWRIWFSSNLTIFLIRFPLEKIAWFRTICEIPTILLNASIWRSFIRDFFFWNSSNNNIKHEWLQLHEFFACWKFVFSFTADFFKTIFDFRTKAKIAFQFVFWCFFRLLIFACLFQKINFGLWNASIWHEDVRMTSTTSTTNDYNYEVIVVDLAALEVCWTNFIKIHSNKNDEFYGSIW